MAKLLGSSGKITIQGLNYLEAGDLQKLLPYFMNRWEVYISLC